MCLCHNLWCPSEHHFLPEGSKWASFEIFLNIEFAILWNLKLLNVELSTFSCSIGHVRNRHFSIIRPLFINRSSFFVPGGKVHVAAEGHAQKRVQRLVERCPAHSRNSTGLPSPAGPRCSWRRRSVRPKEMRCPFISSVTRERKRSKTVAVG